MLDFRNPPDVCPSPPRTLIMDRIRILLVDDHALLRETLRHYLQTQPDMEVVGEAGSAE
jgi:hypothetical protein